VCRIGQIDVIVMGQLIQSQFQNGESAQARIEKTNVAQSLISLRS